MSKKTNNKKAMATVNINDHEALFQYASGFQSFSDEVIARDTALKAWDTEHNFRVVVAAARKKDAASSAIHAADELKAARAMFAAGWDEPLKAARQTMTKAVAALIGAKKSARRAEAAKVYAAYVESATCFSASYASLENAVRAFLLVGDGLHLHTDAKTAANIAARVAAAAGMKNAGAGDVVGGRAVGSVAVMTESGFYRFFVAALASIAATGTVEF